VPLIVKDLNRRQFLLNQHITIGAT
jgi:hypothetical protein